MNNCCCLRLRFTHIQNYPKNIIPYWGNWVRLTDQILKLDNLSPTRSLKARVLIRSIRNSRSASKRSTLVIYKITHQGITIIQKISSEVQ